MTAAVGVLAREWSCRRCGSTTPNGTAPRDHGTGAGREAPENAEEEDGCSARSGAVSASSFGGRARSSAPKFAKLRGDSDGVPWLGIFSPRGEISLPNADFSTAGSTTVSSPPPPPPEVKRFCVDWNFCRLAVSCLTFWMRRLEGATAASDLAVVVAGSETGSAGVLRALMVVMPGRSARRPLDMTSMPEGVRLRNLLAASEGVSGREGWGLAAEVEW